MHNRIDDGGDIPPPHRFSHIRLIQDPLFHLPTDAQNVSIGAGRPPVPTKLMNKIESGVFVEMAELLPERLGVLGTDDDAKQKPKKRSLSILEWLQCYAVYVAVISKKQPERIPDLMGYQSLVIEAYMEYKNDCWIGYDRRFRQQAASQPHRPWSTIDSTLWTLAFAGQAKTSRCKHCFSLAHQSNDCDLAPEPSIKPYQYSQRRQICFHWNETLNPTCSFPNCKYQHICYICAHDPGITNVSHKAIHCPQRMGQSSIKPLFPPDSNPRLPVTSRT